MTPIAVTPVAQAGVAPLAAVLVKTALLQQVRALTLQADLVAARGE